MLPLALPAFIAGVLMFLAPCTLPIVPGYLAFIGAAQADAAGRGDRRRIILNALAFVIGFSVIFILLGVFAGWIGSAIGAWRYFIARAAGAILILFGLTMLGSAAVPVLAREYRLPLPRALTLGRPESSLLVGMLFALGWSPCIGPILGSILFLASSAATALSGALLLAVFSLGLGVPFLLCAAFITYASDRIGKLGPFSQALQVAGGTVLIALGILMVFNLMGVLVGWGYGLFGFLHYDRLLNYL